MTEQPPAVELRQPCVGFPDQCRNLVTVDPNPPDHGGGVRCGCDGRSDLEDMAFSLATGLGGIVEPDAFKAALDRHAAQVLRAFADSVTNLPPGGEALRGKYWYMEGRKETADMAREKAEQYEYEAEQRMKEPRKP
ncbi:hypothetical protein AB0G67_40355 [Streptomyces sp. NPDC021056]|uniref:hypothetical protein n=1 Tax=Streptomyces sp. NPDC021056 TaxID=3155012 RepID=UPI003410874F